MTAAVQLFGERVKYMSKPSVTTAVTVMTAVSENPELVEIYVTNTDSVAREARMIINDGSTDYPLYYITLDAGTSELLEFMLPLDEGESLKVQTPDAADIMSFISIFVERGSQVKDA